MEPKPAEKTESPGTASGRSRSGSPTSRPGSPSTGQIVAGRHCGSPAPPSDRSLKEGFEPVDPRAILAAVATLPIERWSYKGETVRHLGPMAQDFAAAFGLGADDRHIFPLDAAGVALAAIQGLHGLVQAQGSPTRGPRARTGRAPRGDCRPPARARPARARAGGLTARVAKVMELMPAFAHDGPRQRIRFPHPMLAVDGIVSLIHRLSGGAPWT